MERGEAARPSVERKKEGATHETKEEHQQRRLSGHIRRRLRVRHEILRRPGQRDAKLDDQVGSAVPHSFFHVETKPGEHQMSATTEWKHQKPITVTTNGDSYVRLKMMVELFVGHVIPEVMPETKATTQMNGLHLSSKGTVDHGGGSRRLSFHAVYFAATPRAINCWVAAGNDGQSPSLPFRLSR